MKNILHNFWITLRSYPFVVALNIIGLGIAIAVAYMIVVQVHNDLSYNSSIKDAERIVRIELRRNYNNLWNEWQTENSEQMIMALRNIAGVESVGVLNLKGRHDKFSIDGNVIPLTLSFVSNEALELFSFDIIEGSVMKLNRSNGDEVIVSESFAEKHNLEVGSYITRENFAANALFYYGKKMKVGAIFRDFKNNCDLSVLDIVVRMGDVGGLYEVSGHQFYFVSYLKLAPGYSVDALNKAMNEIVAAEFSEEMVQFRAMPLLDTHFYGAEVDGIKKGNLMSTVALIAIAVVLVSIAFVNYLNFFLSLVPSRVRNVNTQKILGASVWQLRFTFIMESVMMVMLSVGVALLVIVVTERSEFLSLFTADLSLLDNGSIALLVLFAVLLFAVAVPLYPAFYVTSFTAALALNGNFVRNKAGSRIRITLLIIEFVMSFVLIIIASFIHYQNSFMINADVGFDKEQVLIATPRNMMYLDIGDHSELRKKLNEHPDIIDVAFATGNIISDVQDVRDFMVLGGVSEGTEFSDDKVSMTTLGVSLNFLQVLGIEVYDGRDFNIEDNVAAKVDEYSINIPVCGYICNEQARKRFSLTTDNNLNNKNEPIVGFCRDFKCRSLQYQVEPLTLMALGAFVLPVIYAKVEPDCDFEEVAGHIRSVATDYFGEDNSNMDIELLGDIMRSEYKDEQLKALQISSFATVSIIVSLMGLLATVLFEVKYIEREIALRRIHGATVWSIVRLINIKYLRMIAISFIIALPVAVYAVHEWLSNFAYKTNIYWWIFALVLLAVSAVAVIVVTITCWRTANRNPLDVINKG